MAKLIGTDPNQVPSNADLGDLAYQNKEDVRVDNLTVDGNINDTISIDSSGNVDVTGTVTADTASIGTISLFSNEINQVNDSGNIYLGYRKTQNLYFTTGGTTGPGTVKMRLDPNGDLYMTPGGGDIIMANGAGIDFSASEGSGASASILDDYEEGTWTPVIRISNTATGITFSVQQGSYTKIGRQVTCNAALIFSNKGSNTGAVTLDNIPFAVANLLSGTSVEASGHVGYAANMTSNFATITLGIGGAGTTECDFYYQNALDTAMNVLNGTNLANNTTLRFSFTYFTNS